MLEFALEYRHAIDAIMADRDAELHAFELSKAEWNIVQQLHDVLKVSLVISVLRLWTDFRGFFTILFNLIFTFYQTEVKRL